LAPIQVKIKNAEKNVYSLSFILGENFLRGEVGVFRRSEYKIKILIKRAKTPPNLLGIERRIAYANKKYHSG